VFVLGVAAATTLYALPYLSIEAGLAGVTEGMAQAH
jgi:hypothetical protein